MVAAGHNGQAPGRAGQQRADLLDVSRVVQHHEYSFASEQAAVQRGLGWQARWDPRHGNPERVEEPAHRLFWLKRVPVGIGTTEVDIQLPVGEVRGHAVRPMQGNGGLARSGGA